MSRLAPLLPLLVLATSCSSLSRDPQIAERVECVRLQNLREHVLALEAIGPRPVSDPFASRATLEYLGARLQAAGFEVREEPFEVQLGSSIVALARPLDDPQAELTEIPVAPELLMCGTYAMKAKSASLRSEGWKVEGYRGQGGGQPLRFEVSNLIATRAGTTEPERVIELSAHYDTVPECPGAADNASGVGALLEVARVLADTPTSKSVRLCFFAGEEIGLRGSAEHMRQLLQDDGSTVEALINLDSVAFTGEGEGSQVVPEEVPWYLFFPHVADFVLVIGDWASGPLGNDFEAAIDVYVPELDYYSANRIGGFFHDAERSDHSHYWRAGIPAIFVTDSGEFRRDAYHGPHDTSESLDLEFLESVTKATLATTLHLAEMD